MKDVYTEMFAQLKHCQIKFITIELFNKNKGAKTSFNGRYLCLSGNT
jgi:hypothetical protein